MTLYTDDVFFLQRLREELDRQNVMVNDLNSMVMTCLQKNVPKHIEG